jgi:hypothetical protein
MFPRPWHRGAEQARVSPYSSEGFPPQWRYNRHTGEIYDASLVPIIGAGISTAETTQEEKQTVWSALKAITPSLIVGGIVTGAAFAIGSGLVSRLIFRDHRR